VISPEEGDAAVIFLVAGSSANNGEDTPKGEFG
jgi:hypothetical protein